MTLEPFLDDLSVHHKKGRQVSRTGNLNVFFRLINLITIRREQNQDLIIEKHFFFFYFFLRQSGKLEIVMSVKQFNYHTVGKNSIKAREINGEN